MRFEEVGDQGLKKTKRKVENRKDTERDRSHFFLFSCVFLPL